MSYRLLINDQYEYCLFTIFNTCSRDVTQCIKIDGTYTGFLLW